MLLITVEIAGGGLRRKLAEARVGNISDLADVSDYAVYAEEGENPLADTTPWNARGLVAAHRRNQTVWRLVERVASWAAGEGDKKRGPR
jgi:hypothetical protein